MRNLKWVVVAAILMVILLPVVSLFRGRAKAPLTESEQVAWDHFRAKHLSSQAVTPNETEADAVVAIGDKIVPYIEENLGAAARVPGTYGKGEYWLIIVLARIGTPRALDGIEKVLKHDFPGAMGRNRETAAKALVWLGATDRAPVLAAAIEDHERRVAESGDPQRYMQEVENLKKYLELLKQGKGKRDKSTFPFGPGLIDEAVEIPSDAVR